MEHLGFFKGMLVVQSELQLPKFHTVFLNPLYIHFLKELINSRKYFWKTRSESDMFPREPKLYCIRNICPFERTVCLQNLSTRYSILYSMCSPKSANTKRSIKRTRLDKTEAMYSSCLLTRLLLPCEQCYQT